MQKGRMRMQKSRCRIKAFSRRALRERLHLNGVWDGRGSFASDWCLGVRAVAATWDDTLSFFALLLVFLTGSQGRIYISPSITVLIV
jgi:hypothetical protein